MTGTLVAEGALSKGWWFLVGVAALWSGCTEPRPVPGPRGVDLVVASSHPEDLLQFLVKEYRERTGQRVEVVRGGTGSLLHRLHDSELGVDVLLGGGLESLEASRDLFEPYRPGASAVIPPEFRSPEGLWTGFSVLSLLIVYNQRLVEPEVAPRAWADLVHPRFQGNIAFSDPRQSGSAYSLLRVFSGLSSSEPRLLDRFVANLGGRPLLESSQVVAAVSSGEFLVGLTFESPTPLVDVGLVYPREGTLVLPDGVALMRRAPHPEAARGFIDFVLGPEVADVLAGRFHRRSVRLDAVDPDGLVPLKRLPRLPYDVSLAAREKEATLERFSALWSRRP